MFLAPRLCLDTADKSSRFASVFVRGLVFCSLGFSVFVL